MKHTFEIPGPLPGLNEIFGAANRHRHVGATLKKRWTNECGQWVIAGRVPFFKGPVRIQCDWFEPDLRRDVDNVAAGAKFILDALVMTGRLPNDGRRWVRSIAHTFPAPDPSRPRVEVTIEEVP